MPDPIATRQTAHHSGTMPSNSSGNRQEYHILLIVACFVYEAQSHCVTLAALELSMFLPQPPKS